MRQPRSLAALFIVLASLALPAHADHDESQITGVVTNAGGDPLPDICVRAYDSWDSWWHNETRTDENGRYTLFLWERDPKVLRFSDCSSARTYATEWFDDATFRADATEVTPSTSAEANAVLELGGTITGRATDTDGRGLRSLCVSATGSDGEVAASTSTNDNGVYSIPTLRGGVYRVRFGGCDQNAPPMFIPRTVSTAAAEPSSPSSPPATAFGPDHLPEWYDDASSFEDAMPVSVLSGAVTPAIDAQLTLGGWITGVLTRADGSPFTSGCVEAYDNEVWRASATTDEGGFYRLRALDAGAYTVSFVDCGFYRHRTEWYDDVLSQGLATPLQVTLGAGVTGVDASLELAPMADMAVTGLQVQNVPLETDAASLGTGILRDVHVEVSNLGAVEARYVGLTVWLSMQDGTRRALGRDWWFDVPAGDEWRGTYRWDARGDIGDATVYAEVCTSWQLDADHRNDVASKRTYSVVGGTGVGVTLQRPSWEYCSPYPWES